MSRSKRERKIDETYYDLLNWLDSQIELKPLTLAELGLMFYILQACNKNYSDDCKINLKVVAAKTGTKSYRLADKLDTLCAKGYIKSTELAPNIYYVAANWRTNGSEKQDIVPLSAPREDKKREDEKKTNLENFNKGFNKSAWDNLSVGTETHNERERALDYTSMARMYSREIWGALGEKSDFGMPPLKKGDIDRAIELGFNRLIYK